MQFDANFPSWLYAVGGLAIVLIAYQTGSKVGAFMIVLVLVAMVGNAYKRGEIKN